MKISLFFVSTTLLIQFNPFCSLFEFVAATKASSPTSYRIERAPSRSTSYFAAAENNKSAKNHNVRKLAGGEFDVLSKFYNDTSGASWAVKNNWMNGVDPCASWYGVTCSSGGEVVGVSMDANALVGRLSSELGLLTSCTSLILFSNTLFGPIPSELGMMNGLSSSFSVYTNFLTGSIPSELGKLTKLVESFLLNGNMLSGSIPSELGMMTGLTYGFESHRNSLTGSLPSELGMMTKMTGRFIVFINSLNGSIPSELGQMTWMGTALYLDSNSFTGCIPSEIGKMTRMSNIIKMRSNYLSGTIPSELGKLTKLAFDFEFQSNALSGSIPSQLGRLTKMTHTFYLYSNSLCGVTPPQVSALSSNVDLYWDITTGNSLGTLCYDPTPIPSSTPTLSLLPSHVPTLTLLPTSSPSDNPTSVPTLIPSFSPTSLPTLSPSSSPTPVPTIQPTPIPTSLPTIKCGAGTYFDWVNNVCVNCAPGKFSNHTEAPFSTECDECPGGKFTSTAGESVCTDCANGKLSNTARTSCDNCNAGEYAQNNVCNFCDSGKYAPVPLEDDCLTCNPGFYTNNETGASSCTACSAGTWSLNVSILCKSCSTGKYQSASGQSLCLDCSSGTVATSSGATSCTACSSGEYSVNASSACQLCSPGKYQKTSSQTSCDSCDSGTYSRNNGATTCLICSSGYDSDIGSSSCHLAAAKFFLFANNNSKVCPKDSECVGRYQSPVPSKGYWVDRRSYVFAGHIHKCTRSTCTSTRDSSDACWATNSSVFTTTGYDMNRDECGSTKLICSTGAQGPLCGSCKEDFVFNSEIKVCEPCSRLNIKVLFIIGLVFVIILLILLIVLGTDDLFCGARKVLSCYDSGSLKVLCVTYQIVSSCSWNLDVTFPSPFNNMLGIMTVFSFDFLTLECLQQGSAATRYFTKIYMWCLLPIILVLFIVFVGVIRVRLSPNNVKKTINNQHIWMSLFVTYLALPVVANKQFQSLDCMSLSKEQISFLRVDAAIDCYSPTYKRFRVSLILFILLYQSIPIIWFTLLYCNKSSLNRKHPNHDEKLELFVRDNDRSLDRIRFLFNDYGIDKWWFEVLETYRRVLFVGILPLSSTVTSKRASFGCYLAIASMVYFREKKPFRNSFNNFIAYVSQIMNILFTYFSAISIETGAVIDFGISDFGMGVFLVFSNLFICVLVQFDCILRYTQKKQKENMKKGESLECAIGFSSNQFRSLFVSMNKSLVPSPNVLVFYYASFDLARVAMSSGLPSSEIFQGVPFSLRGPHQIGSAERSVFKNEHHTSDYPNDVLLVYSLPRVLLQSLKGYKDERYLCCLSVGILNAMHPMHPSEDMKPWDDGMARLPPSCILKSYQLNPQTATMDEMMEKKETVDPYAHHVVPPKLEMKDVIRVNSFEDYLDQMKFVRERSSLDKLIPLYHYTSYSSLSLILEYGMRLSTLSLVDGGVHFSLNSPLSYNLGEEDYEENIIKYCFGVDRVDKFMGKDKLGAVIVYGCDASLLSQPPGGRDNTYIIPKSYFSSLMLPQLDGNFFLRPDRILAVFVINNKVLLHLSERVNSEVNAELQFEKEIRKELDHTIGESTVFARELFETARQLLSNSNMKGDIEGGGYEGYFGTSEVVRTQKEEGVPGEEKGSKGTKEDQNGGYHHKKNRNHSKEKPVEKSQERGEEDVKKSSRGSQMEENKESKNGVLAIATQAFQAIDLGRTPIPHIINASMSTNDYFPSSSPMQRAVTPDDGGEVELNSRTGTTI